MKTYRLSDISKALAGPDATNRERSVMRSDLTNLQQKFRLPVADRDVIADLFPESSVAAFVILLQATKFGLFRERVHNIATWLISANPQCGSDPVDGGFEVRSIAEEAILRVHAGEGFDFHVIQNLDGSCRMWADWRPALKSERVERAAHTAPEHPAAIWMTVKASDLIRDILSKLEA